MYVTDNTGTQIEEFILSTAWNISTATDSGSPLNIEDADSGNNIEDIAFNSDGTKMFLVDRGADNTSSGARGDFIMEYTLSIAYDISTATYSGDGERLNVGSQTQNPEDMAFNTDGTKLFVLQNKNDDSVLEYTCSIGFDVSSCSHASSDLALVNGSGTALDASDAFEFSSDGTTMFIADPGSDLIQQYTLSTAWDVSSSTHAKTFDISSQEPNARGLAFDKDGNKLYVTGTSDTVWQFNLSS